MAQSSAFDSMHPAGKLPPTLTPTGHFAGKPTLPISRSVTLIGARKQARLQLISSTVSQSHALIVNADSGPYIRDLASREHVFVNGIQVREGQLADGDEIQIGRFTFRFNESPTTQPAEAIRNIPNAPIASLELDGADAPMPIESKSILIGRRDTCDVPLLEDTASTTHAIIFEMDGHRYLRDLASRTGTFVNGRQVHQIELSPGDEIKIGQTTIRYHAEATPARDVMPSRLAPADLGAIGDDLVPLDDAPRKMPVPQPRPTPPRAAAAPVVPPVVPIAPAGTESLELIQDQSSETEEVELTPEDLEVAPIEVEQDLLTPIETESPTQDEVELEPLALARDEPVEIEAPQPESSTARTGANESADLSDLVPAGEEIEPAEVELEPLDVARDEPLDVRSTEPLDVDVEPITEAPGEEAREEVASVEATPAEEGAVAESAVEESAVDDEVSLEPIADVEPEPVVGEHDLDVEPVATAEPEAEPEPETDELALAAEEPATEPVSTGAPADDPVAEEESPPEEGVLTSESIDELLLLTPSSNPTAPVVQSKFAPGASQLDLEPVTEIDAPAPSSDMLSLEPTVRAPQPIVQPAAAKPVEAKVKDDLFRAPPIAPVAPRPQPVAPAPLPIPPIAAPPVATPPRAPAPPPKVAAERTPPQAPPPAPLPIDVEQIRFDTPEIAGFENGIGKSPGLSELAFDESSVPELEMPTGAGDLNFDSPDLATSLDFTALDDGALSTDAFAPVGEADIDIPSLDLGTTDIEAIPGLESPSPFGEAPDVTFDLDSGSVSGQPMADTIVGADTPVFSAPAVEESPRPKAKAKAPVKPSAPARKAPKAPKAVKPKPVTPSPAPHAPTAPPALEVPPAPALDLSFPPVSAPLAPPRAEPALPLEAPATEVLPATESTPESALALDDAVSNAPPEAPAIGEPRSVELTDSSFGRAVESFVGESTGPIVEEAIAPQADAAAPATLEPEIELEPTPEPAPLPADDAPEPILPISPTPRPIETEPIEPDKLFDLEPIDVAQEKPAADTKPQAEPEIQLHPVAEVEPPRVEAPSAHPVEIAPQPPAPVDDKAESMEVESTEGALDPVDLETLEPTAAAPVRESPLDEPPVASGATDDAIEEWGLDVEPAPASPAAPPAPQRPAPQPIAQAPTPPAAPPTSPSSAHLLWGADQDHFLGGRPLPLGGVAPPPARQRPAPPPPPAHEQPAAPIGLTTPMPSIPPPPRSLPRPQRAKPDQVGTAFDGLALPVRETDVFGNFNTGLTSALGAGMTEDIFGRRMTGPTPQPQIPASQPGHPPAQPPAPRRPVPRRASRSEATGDSWTPPTPPPAPHSSDPHAPAADQSADVEPQEIESVEIEHEELPPPEPPPRKKRRWFGLRSLLFLMLLCMSAAGVLIYYTPIVPNHSSVAGDLAFANHDKVPRIELSRLEGEQKQQLNELRATARSRLLATSANNARASFLDDQVGYLRTVSLAKMDLETGVFTVTRPSASPGDQAAMLALLQALYDANGKLVAESSDLARTVESLTRGRGEDEARLAALKQEIDRLGVVAQSAPSDTERAKLEAQAAQLQSDASSAQLIATRLGDALKQVQQDSSAVAPVESQATAGSDAVLTQIEGQMKALNERINAVQEGRSENARAARDQLDSAIAAFNKQIEHAQGAVKDNPQLLAYVNSAQKLLTSSRELTDQLIKRQQDQYARLSELKTGLNDKMLARRAEVWKKDPELLKLMDQKDIKSRRLNVARDQGLTKEADEIQAELNLIESMIQARQTVVADDGFYADAIDQIQKVIDATQRGLDDDRKLTMQKLDEMQASLAKDQPQLATLTPEQKQLAEEMEKRLADLSAARRQYTENSDTANRQADDEMRSLQASASELTSKFQARKRELDAAGEVPVPPPAVDPAVATDARQKAIEQKTAEFAAAEKVRTEAETALLAVNKQLLELKTRAEQAAKAGQERDQKIRQRDREQQELDQRINQYEMKKKLADQKAYPIAPTQASVRYDKKDDLRPYALLGVAALIIGVFVATIMLTDIRRGDDSAEQPQLPDAFDLDAPGGLQLHAPSHRADRHAHAEV